MNQWTGNGGLRKSVLQQNMEDACMAVTHGALMSARTKQKCVPLQLIVLGHGRHVALLGWHYMH
jgi:hypothetical protein